MNKIEKAILEMDEMKRVIVKIEMDVLHTYSTLWMEAISENKFDQAKEIRERLDTMLGKFLELFDCVDTKEFLDALDEIKSRQK